MPLLIAAFRLSNRQNLFPTTLLASQGMRTATRLVIVAALVAAVAACGGSASEPATTGANTTTLPATTTTAVSTTPAPTTTAASSTSQATTTTVATTTTIAVDGATDIVITLVGGEVSGPARPTVNRGDDVTITVTADVTDEVHVHGYDLFADIGPDAPAELSFTADIPGIVEVELESSHLLLFELEVG